MLKLLIIPLILIVQLVSSQIDTTQLNYPRIAYPGEVIKEKVVLFTPLQAKLATIDAINADSYKEQNDSLKSALKGFNKLIKLKNAEIQQLNFDRNVRDEIIDGYKTETSKFKGWYEDSQAKLHLTQKVDKIVYPILGGVVLSFSLYVIIASVK